MATFNVFVEGPIDDSPTALPELAKAMSQRYGVPATELVTRLERGRFRVKSNLDAAGAERYKRDLESIGARVLVEDSSLSPTATPPAGSPAVRPSNLSLPPTNERQPASRATPATGLAAAGPAYQRPSTPIPTGGPAKRPSTPIPTGPAHARPSTPIPTAGHGQPRTATPPSGLSAAGPAHARPSTPIPTGDLSSGLAAAFTEAPAQADLGALGNEGALSLASLDGEEEASASASFDLAPEEPVEPVVSIKPRTTEPPRNKPAPSQPMDLFAPPDAGDEDLAVELATEEVEERAHKRASAPPENARATPASQPTTPATRRTPAAMEAAAEPAPSARKPEFSRARFGGIVALALVLGFIPAHFVASMRENSAFAAIDNRVVQVHALADTPETWLALDGARAKLLDDKESKRQMIALTSMLLWAIVSAGIGFALLRYAPERK